jgi:hypothetical protein
MKIALCLYGYFNSLTDLTAKGIDGFDYIKRKILNVGNSAGVVDVYIHNWEPDMRAQLMELYSPKRIVVEPQIDFTPLVVERGLDKLPVKARSPFAIFSHFYSIQQSFQLISDLEEYDIVINSRFDLSRINRMTSGPHLANPYPIQCINFDLDLPMNKFYVANWDYFDTGPADAWFYSGPKNMKYFCNIYDDILECLRLDSDYAKHAIYKEGYGNIANASMFYGWWLKEKGIWDKMVPLDSGWE